MIYLKKISVNNPSGKNGQVKEYKDNDTKTVEFLQKTGHWMRIAGRKDYSPYVAPKKTKKTK